MMVAWMKHTHTHIHGWRAAEASEVCTFSSNKEKHFVCGAAAHSPT